MLMAVVLMMILTVLIIPVPTPLLDLLLALSIGLGILVLLLTVQIKRPMQLSSFPSLLLILTLFRLSMNVATTRQILLEGYAGKVIESFGEFVVGGNYFVGAVVFLILTVINFMVITKGSGRIAEVAARFTLDSMPGKQMSIDADLNSGLIDEKEAVKRRTDLYKQSDFFGAMDGASKFVRGDAVAGLIITIINIAGGFAVGMLQQGMDAGEALRKYTLLTIGDGLVSQIPALIISTAAGMLVTRSAAENSLGMEVGKQLFVRSKPMMITGGILSVLALLPGLPFLPFVMLGCGIGAVGYAMRDFNPDSEKTTGAGPEESGTVKALGAGKKGALPVAGQPKAIPGVSLIDLEIGFGLVAFVDSKYGGRLIDRIGVVRGQLAEELGVVLPPVNVRDNVKLKNTEYCIRIRGIECGRGVVRPGMFLAINSGGLDPMKEFPQVREPAFGFEAYWIPEEKKEFAEAKGYTVVDCTSVITTHLAEVAKTRVSEMLTRQDVSDMIDGIKESNSSIVQDLIPGKVGVGTVHRVLQKLLDERVSVRDLPMVLESISDRADKTQNSAVLAEFVRKSLGGQICHQYLGPDGVLHAISLHPDVEAHIKAGIRREANELGSLTMDPSLARRMLEVLGSVLKKVRETGVDPVLLCSPLIRAQMRQLTSHEYASMPVISFAEVPDRMQVNMEGVVEVSGITGPGTQEAAA
jgi:flagellar biosynthesis protein FlhA